MLQLYILPFSQIKLIQLFLKLCFECTQNVSDINRATSRQGYPSHSLSGAPQTVLCPSLWYHAHGWLYRMLHCTANTVTQSALQAFFFYECFCLVSFFVLYWLFLHLSHINTTSLFCVDSPVVRYFFICSSIHHTSQFLSNFCISHQRVDNTLPEDFIRLGQTDINTNY